MKRFEDSDIINFCKFDKKFSGRFLTLKEKKNDIKINKKKKKKKKDAEIGQTDSNHSGIYPPLGITDFSKFEQCQSNSIFSVNVAEK